MLIAVKRHQEPPAFEVEDRLLALQRLNKSKALCWLVKKKELYCNTCRKTFICYGPHKGGCECTDPCYWRHLFAGDFLLKDHMTRLVGLTELYRKTLKECPVCGAEENEPCSVFNPETGMGEELYRFVHEERL